MATDSGIDTTSDIGADTSTDTDTETDTGTDTDTDWILISAGTFDMGSTSGGSDELPVHTVAVPGFYFNKTKTTVEQYNECIGTGSCTVPTANATSLNWGVDGFEHHPINGAMYGQVQAYCEWIGDRLPSELEWEYASRNGGQDIDYPRGDEGADSTKAVMKADTNGCDTGHTMPVCSIEAGNTNHGLCDMSCNVWEYVEDLYLNSYEGAPTDGHVWESNGGTRPVLRGGIMDNYID